MTSPAVDPAVAAMHAVINGAQRRMDALSQMIEAIHALSYDDRVWCIDSLNEMIVAGKESVMLPLLGKPVEKRTASIPMVET